MQRDPLTWRVGERDIDCSETTLVMGIINVTPDSFSDGGQLANVEAAVTHGVQMAADGADFLDVGGESTRPGSDPVPVDEEIARTLPVIEGLVAQVPGVPVSIDTRKAEVATAAVAAGASIVNDVSAGADPAMFGTVASHGVGMVLMHMQGDPKTMQEDPHYEDVVSEVVSYLGARLDAALAAGIERDALVVDPGIGFGKTLEHNLALMKNIDAVMALGRPVLVGPSRKRFIGTLLGTEVDERLEGTAGAVAWLAGAGAHIVRVHDVKEMVRVARVVDAIARA